jgi:hypothetical protein
MKRYLSAKFSRVGPPDQIVALAADENAAVVVTWNAKHFERLIERIPIGGKRTLRHASRLVIVCREPEGRRRIEEDIAWVEFEWSAAQQRKDKRVMLEIGGNYHKSWR